MNRLLKLEFRKLRKQKSFYICTFVMIALLFLSAMTTKAMCNANAAFSAQYQGSGIVSAVHGVSNCSFLLLAGIFTALFVCDDYEQQTVKNIYAKGYSRSKVYVSKFISIVCSVTLMFLIAVVSAFFFGNMYFGADKTGGSGWVAIIGVQYVICMANISFYFAVSSVLRKNGSSIAAVIVAPMLVNMVLGLADSFLRSEKVMLTSLWISSFLDDLSTVTVDHNRLITCLIASLIYIPLFLMIGFLFHKKIEL